MRISRKFSKPANREYILANQRIYKLSKADFYDITDKEEVLILDAQRTRVKEFCSL